MSKKYIYNGEEFTEEQLQSNAAAQNLTLDELLDLLPNIEIVTPDPILESAKKTQGPAKEAAIVGPQNTKQPSTDLPGVNTSLELPKDKVSNLVKPLDKTVYRKEEEEGVRDLRKFYDHPNISFEETTAEFSDKVVGDFLGGRLLDAVAMVYTDPKTGKKVKSDPLQFDTTLDYDIDRNNKIAADFFKTHVQTEDYDQILKNRSKLTQQALESVDSYIPSEKKTAIAEEYSRDDLFEPYYEEVRVNRPVGFGPTGGMLSSPTQQKLVEPYKQELTETFNSLQKAKPNESVEKLKEEAEKRVRAQLKEIALSEARTAGAENAILESGDVAIAPMSSFGPYGQVNAKITKKFDKEKQKDFQSDVFVANKLALIETQTIANRYELAANTMGLMNNVVGKIDGATQEDYNQITENANTLGLEFNKTGELVTLTNGNRVDKGFVELFDNLHNVAFADNEIYKGYSIKGAEAADMYSKLSDITEASALNYDLGEKYMSNIGLGFADIGFSTLYLGGKVLALGEYASPMGYYGPKPMNDALDSLAVKYGKATNDIRSSYTRDVSFEDAFSTPDNFGKFAMQELTNQIPILIAMMASGGAAAYVIGASSAGGKMIDMRTEIATGGADYNEGEIWLKSVGYGIAEGGFAQLTTIPLLNKAKATWIKNGKGSVVDNTSKQFIKDKYKGLIYDPLLEAAGEVGTIGAQNLIDGNPMTLGMDHAGFSGAAFGMLFSAVPFLKGMHTSTFSDYNADKKIRDLKTRLGELAATRENLTSEISISEIDNEIAGLNNELANEINAQEDALKNLVTHKFGERITGIIERQSNLKIQAQQVMDDATLDTKTKQNTIARLQKSFDRLQNIKELALSDSFKRKFEGEFKALEGTDKAAYDGYLSEAQETLYQENNNADVTQEEIFRKGHDLYLLDKVQEANNKLKNFKGFKIFKTQAEAIAAIENNNSIEDADKADLIENIKNGDDGAAYRKGDERLTYVVEENQVLNQRKYIATHEVGHDVFWDILGTNDEAFEPIARQLLEGTKNVDAALYKELSKETDAKEVVSRFLELVAGGDVNFRKNEKKKGLAGLFGSMIQKEFEGDYDFDFKGETDMFNFVVGIGKKIADGSLTTADIKSAKSNIIAQNVGGRVVQMPPKAEQTSLKNAASVARSKGTLDEALNKFSQNEDGSPKFASKDEWRSSSEAGEAYFTVQQTSLLDGEIRKQARLKGLPEDVDINEIKDNIALRVFENYDPSKNNLFGYLLGKVNIVEKAVLDAAKKFGSRVESTAASIDTAAGETGAVAEIEADITTVEEKQEREAKEEAEEASTFNLTTSKAIEPATIEKAKAKVLSIVRTLKNKLGEAVSKNVNTVPVVKEVIQTAAKSIDIDLKKQMGGKGDLKLRKFVIDNKTDIINNASATWLMGKDTGTEVKGGMPIAIEKSVGGKFTGKTIEINVGGKTVKVQEFKPNFVPYPEWVGQKIDREKTVERGQTSGNEIVRKVNPAKISDNAFADFVTTEDGTPIRGRKESLANELAGRLGGQIFKEAMADPDSDISKAFEQNQDLRGAVLSDNFRNEVIEQTERGLIARSAGVDALTQEMNTIIKDVFDRKSYKSMGEALGRLETIKDEFKELKLTSEIKESIDTVSRIIQDIVWGEKNRGVQAEIEMVNAIKKAAKVIPGLYIDPNFNPAGTKGGVPDIVFYLDGKKITLENKLTIYSQIKALPALSITKDGIAPIKTGDAELDAKLNNAVKNHKPLQKLIKLLAEDGRGEYSTLRTGRKTIRIKKSEGVGGQQQGFYWQAENLVKKEFGENNFELKVKGTIKDLNTILGKNDFQTNEIHFMDVGLVQLSEFSKLNTPNKLNLDDTVDIRFVVYRNASTDSKGNIKHYNLTIKPTFLLSESSRTKVSASETVNFVNPGDISKATKNTYNSNATQAASKGKADVDKLNKQYETQQESLVAQSKGKLNAEMNRIIERGSGIGARKKLSAVAARRMGKNKGVFKLFLPPGAEDLKGLYYTMLGKGRQGDADKKFFEDNLVKPYARGIAAMEKAKQALLNDYKALRKVFKAEFKKEGIKIGQDIPNAKITVEQAIRIYLWSNADAEIPGLTPADQKKALEYVYKNPVVQAYADSLLAISKQDQWSKPSEYWDAQSILSDLNDIALNVNRKQYLEQFIANKNEMFSTDNLNKLEAAYGVDFRESVEDIMYRMETGSNRPTGRNTIAKKWNNWLNNSVGAIMFFNRRSATLQLLSTINFMNTSDNNPLKAGLAFANQPQYWKDWAMIFNSPKLKERRGGLKNEVQASEIAEAARGAKNKPLAIISYLLKIGFLPTQIADSVAIASGGAAFYRNRVNTYKKQGFDQAEAEAKAFEDFSLISDETQQSGDPMLVSRQQADPIGRPILAFQNTPMQITRFQKRNVQDLINRRRIPGKTQFQSDATYLTRIAYYTAVQNLIFSTLQQGLFTLLPGFDDEEDENIEKTTERKVFDTANSMLDTTLRGSGIVGAVGSTLKNVIIEYMRQQEKDPFAKDNAKILLQALNVSPPLGSKARKFYGGFQTMDYEKDVIAARGYGMMIDGKFQLSPSYQVMGSFASAVANVPLDRVVSEVDGITEALDTRNTEYQRLMLALGWKTWQVGAEIEEHEAIKTTAKATRKAEGIEKRKKKAAEKREIEKKALSKMNPSERYRYSQWKLKNKGKRLYTYLEETNQL